VVLTEEHASRYVCKYDVLSVLSFQECTYIHTYIYTHIQDLSQYPEELEYLWLLCSFVAPAGAERMEVTEHGVVRIVPVRVNSNLSARTLDQIVASKKQTHMTAFCFALQEIRRDIFSMWPEEDPWMGSKAERRLTMNMISLILYECKQVLERHGGIEATEFASDETFRHLVTEMLDVKTMAKSKVKLCPSAAVDCLKKQAAL
jgi:hypothetical protein